MWTYGASQNLGAIFLEKKRRLRQRTHKFRASKNMRAIFLKKRRLRQRSQPLLASRKSKKKISKSKSVLPKMLARSGLVGKKTPGPIWGHPGQFFVWAEQIQKMLKKCLFSLVGPCCYPPLVGLLVFATCFHPNYT